MVTLYAAGRHSLRRRCARRPAEPPSRQGRQVVQSVRRHQVDLGVRKQRSSSASFTACCVGSHLPSSPWLRGAAANIAATRRCGARRFVHGVLRILQAPESAALDEQSTLGALGDLAVRLSPKLTLTPKALPSVTGSVTINPLAAACCARPRVAEFGRWCPGPVLSRRRACRRAHRRRCRGPATGLVRCPCRRAWW